MFFKVPLCKIIKRFVYALTCAHTINCAKIQKIFKSPTI